MKTAKELKQIAIEMAEDKIFSDRHIPENQKNMISSIFMPIILGAFSEMSEDEKNDIGLIYEYYSAAGPRGINGFPSFFSLRMLTNEETKKMFKYYDRYKSMKDKFAKS